MADKFYSKFQGGRISAKEFHIRNAFPPGAKCMTCQNRPYITIRVYVTEKDALEKLPLIAVLKKMDPDGYSQLVTQGLFKEPMVLTTTVYACQMCAPEAEKAAAKGPSWAHVDIERPPRDDYAFIQVK